MRSLLALILLWVTGLSAGAQSVPVTSGEHREFTRIVLQFPGPTEWQLGRTLDGYALRIPGQQPDYDMSRAFDLIGKARLASLSTDPQSGDLRLGIACACHAIPFEFRPGIIVVDLYDGRPPEGSSFETPLPTLAQAAPPPPPAPLPVEEPAPSPPAPDGTLMVQGYDWTDLALRDLGLTVPPAATAELDETTPPSASPPGPDINRLRDTLMEELARGASAGMIELAPPPVRAPEAEDPAPEMSPEMAATEAPPADPPAEDGAPKGPDALLTHLGETPGLEIRDVGDLSERLTADGDQCFSDEALDIGAWGSDRAVADQFGPIRQGMTGEFDKPSADAIRRVVRFYLYIGFGAEARSLIRSYEDVLPEAALWSAMARILDGEVDTTGQFRGMEDCDTAAALWAVLSDPQALPKNEIGRAAIARSFSALPPMTRRLLGPRLVRAFLAAEDMSAARAIYEAVLRAPGDASPEIVLMQAEMDRALGDHSQSEARLAPMSEAPGPSASDALVDLVIQRANMGQSVSADQVLALESALKEREGGEDEARYRDALVLAHAASGDFDRAFAETDAPQIRAVIWRLLSQSGGDGALLTHATLPAGKSAPEEAVLSAGLIADRMLMLGLADQAARWLRLAPEVPDLLRAKVALANGDAPAALGLLARDTSEPAMLLKAEALKSMGDEEGAAQVYKEIGNAEAQWSALTRAQSWDSFTAEAPETWKSLAEIVADPAPAAEAPADPAAEPPEVLDPLGPLATNKALVEDSAATRDAITSLLNATEVPAPPSQ